MEKFVPYDKLSKRKRRELDSERRTVWAVSPVTRRPANPKAYNRKKTQKVKFDCFNSVSSFFNKREAYLLFAKMHYPVARPLAAAVGVFNKDLFRKIGREH